MTESIITALISAVVTTLAGAVVGAAIARVKTLSKQTKAERDGIQCLLRAEIIRQHEKYAERGYCPIYAREALSQEYNAYHSLGGNDVATQLYEDLMELPTAPPNESDEKSDKER